MADLAGHPAEILLMLTLFLPGCTRLRFGSRAILAGVSPLTVCGSSRSFVAVPLAGMTLAQLGAEVIRIDPTMAPPDHHRWPDRGRRNYLLGRAEQGYVRWPSTCVRLLVSPCDSADVDCGILSSPMLLVDSGIRRTRCGVCGGTSFTWRCRADADGCTGVDYTVNAPAVFRRCNRAAGAVGPINHALPAWDVSCGLYAPRCSVLAALRHRDATGRQHHPPTTRRCRLTTASNLGFLTEVMI